MIKQYEIYSLLIQEIPQLANMPYPSRPSLQMYASINYFSEYTKHAVDLRNFNQAKKCFNVAETLYLNGDNLVRLLVSDSIIYSLSSFGSMSHTEQLLVKSIIPQKLLALFKNQTG